MLASADAALHERDRHLPGLGLLLDDEGFAETLRGLCPDAAISAVRSTYVRYKPGVSCLVAYRVTTAGGAVDVYARTHRASLCTKIDKAVERDARRGRLGLGVASLGTPPTVIFEFPNDHELRSMSRLVEAESRHRLLQRIFKRRETIWDADAVRLRYKPERRYVTRLDVEGEPEAVLKFYAIDFERACVNAQAFTPDGALGLAPFLGRSRRHRALAFGWIDGVPVEIGDPGSPVSPGDPRDPALPGRIGAALASLHRQQPDLMIRYEPADQISALEEASASVAATCPTLGERARGLAGRLADALVHHDWTRGTVHGDFSIDQIIVDPDRVTIVDLDRAGTGDPAMDLGSLAADLLARAIDAGHPLDQAESFAEAVRSGYSAESRRRGDGARSLFTAAALLKLAVEPFRHRLEGWPALTGDYLDAVAGLLDAGD